MVTPRLSKSDAYQLWSWLAHQKQTCPRDRDFLDRVTTAMADAIDRYEADELDREAEEREERRHIDAERSVMFAKVM